MNASSRRKKILDFLIESNQPLKGSKLSEIYNVSRQVIVQDIALLRARGEDILATPQGYIIPKYDRQGRLVKKLVCKHKYNSEMDDELKTIVDLGGKVVDVMVEHPVYGELKGTLELSSRLDVKEFMASIEKTNAEPLSILTEGVHIHTIEVEDEVVFEKIKEELKKKNYLISED